MACAVLASPALAAGGAPSPLDALPAASAPRTVPYAIGTSVHFRGHVTNVGARIDQAHPGMRLTADQRQVTTVVAGGGLAFAQIIGSGADLVHIVGRISPRGGWTDLAMSAGSMSLVAVTPAGAVGMPESGRLYRADGRLIATFTGSRTANCSFCGMEAAGQHLVVERKPAFPGAQHQGWWLWTPPAAPARLPAGYRSLGRLGAGWLGAPAGTGCWQVAPAASPSATRARICSQTLPLVSADGERAVIVQAGRMRVVSTRTGLGTGLARIGALPNWAPDGTGGAVRYLIPAAWETSDSYLATARDDRTLAMVRCSARTGRCERAVRSTVRPGVSRIVMERGQESITMR